MSVIKERNNCQYVYIINPKKSWFLKVIEKIRGTTVKDTDFMQIGRPITFDWSSKFLEYETTIEKYNIYLSTFPGGEFMLQE